MLQTRTLLHPSSKDVTDKNARSYSTLFDLSKLGIVIIHKNTYFCAFFCIIKTKTEHLIILELDQWCKLLLTFTQNLSFSLTISSDYGNG